MSISPSLAFRIAAGEGFQAENVEKILRLKQLLMEFNRHSQLKGKIVLKGGTALNLFYLDLARLSVDLDLNYVGQVNRELMIRERPTVMAALEQVSKTLNYEVRRVKDDYALVELSLGFRNLAGRADHVQVEINFLYRACALPPEILIAKKMADETDCLFSVLSIEETMAGKLKAMIDRQHPRDLYDVYRFKKARIRHNPDLLRKLTLLFASTMPRDLREYKVKRCERVLTADLKGLLYPLLRADDRPKAGEMFKSVRPLLAKILDRKREEPFLDAMAAGHFIPGLLFRSRPEIAERVENHPALLWKAENVARYISRKKQR